MRPIRYGSLYWERPMRFRVVLPRLEGVSVMAVFCPT